MLTTSLDGQWAIVRRGREVTLLAKAAAPVLGRITLDDDDVDIAFAGPPTVLVAVTRGPNGAKVVLHQVPNLEAVARLDLDQPMRIASITGPRVVLVSRDGTSIKLLRVAARALAWTTIDPGGAIEFSVGLDRNQILFGLPKKLEVWDAVAARPLHRLQLQLPPPPRAVGTAAGHLWVTRPGTDEMVVYRLSDGRPFEHYAGALIEDVVSHPASPLIVLITGRGLVRVHCFAHSLASLETPWRPGIPLAQLVVGNDISLIGIGAADDEPWRLPIGTVGAVAGEPPPPSVPSATAKETSKPSAAPAAQPVDRAWRDPIASFGLDLLRSVRHEVPVVPIDSELGDLAHRMALPPAARRTLIALYATYLVGTPALSIAQLARMLSDWTEPLGQGELAALAMITRRGGKVALRRAVTDYLDGLPPRAIRLVGGAATAPRPGVQRLARDGKSDAAIETELAAQLGRIAVLHGSSSRGVLEARLHGATLVALTFPEQEPEPWPRDAGLVVVGDADVPSWVVAFAPTAS